MSNLFYIPYIFQNLHCNCHSPEMCLKYGRKASTTDCTAIVEIIFSDQPLVLFWHVPSGGCFDAFQALLYNLYLHILTGGGVRVPQFLKNQFPHGIRVGTFTHPLHDSHG